MNGCSCASHFPALLSLNTLTNGHLSHYFPQVRLQKHRLEHCAAALGAAGGRTPAFLIHLRITKSTTAQESAEAGPSIELDTLAGASDRAGAPVWGRARYLFSLKLCWQERAGGRASAPTKLCLALCASIDPGRFDQTTCRPEAGIGQLRSKERDEDAFAMTSVAAGTVVVPGKWPPHRVLICTALEPCRTLNSTRAATRRVLCRRNSCKSPPPRIRNLAVHD